jgi:uncharacterized protein (TIGR03067 family)
LSRLPEEYRIVVALCEFEGRTHREAAGLLGWPIGTVSGRLSRARTMLAKRLARRGVPPSAGSLAVLLAQETASASLPTRLIGPTARAASLLAAGGAEAAGGVAPEVMTLAGGVMKMMWLARLKSAVAVVLALGLVAAGATALALRSARRGDQQPAAGGPVKPPQERRNDGDRTPPATVRIGPTTDHFEPSLQGTWAVVEVQIGGPQPVDAREVNEVRISSDSMTFSYQDRADTLKYRVHRSADPKQIDLTPTGPAADRNEVYRGIYKQDGDELRIAFSKNQAAGATRPVDFGARRGRGDWHYTLRRREAPDHRGRWQAVRFLIDGKADPAEAVGKTELLLDDASYRFVSAPPFGPRGKGSGEGRTVVDLTKAPHHIDLIPSSGPYEGLTQEGIFEVEGDTLKLCYGMPTKARPTEFATRPNSGIYLAEFRRVAERAAKDGPGEPGQSPPAGP